MKGAPSPALAGCLRRLMDGRERTPRAFLNGQLMRVPEGHSFH